MKRVILNIHLTINFTLLLSIFAFVKLINVTTLIFQNYVLYSPKIINFGNVFKN